jgi:hypothetical protein
VRSGSRLFIGDRWVGAPGLDARWSRRLAPLDGYQEPTGGPARRSGELR